MADRHQAPSYPLRMPDDLKEQVANASKESGRSINAEIVARLHKSFDPRPNIAEIRASKDVERLEQQVRHLTEMLAMNKDMLETYRSMYESIIWVIDDYTKNRGPDCADLLSDYIQRLKSTMAKKGG